MMSMFYDTFEEALEAWRELGGTLNYWSGDSIDPEEKWEVILDEGLARDLTIGTNGGDFKTPRELTEHALAMGGLTPEEIEREMADWVDDPAWAAVRSARETEAATKYKEILREAFEHCQVPTLDHAVPVWFSDGAGESERCESLAEVDELAALGDYGGPAEDYRIAYNQRNCRIEALRDGEWVTVFEVSNRLE